MEDRGPKRRESSRRRQPVKTIAVMGPTGVGKSSFINLASNSHLPVGDGLTSCTSAIGHSQVFNINGMLTSLVDTPGFDDTVKPDVEVLEIIAAWLATIVGQGLYLSGIIYMHRITEDRMSGGAMKNLKMFREMCGEKALKNVIIVTNMWGLVDPEVGMAREHELRTDESFFKPWMDAGAGIMHHDNSVQSAHNIISEILRHRPRLLRIQRELVTERRELDETSAWYFLEAHLHQEKKRLEREIQGLQEEHNRAVEDQDEAAQRELEHHREELEERMRMATAQKGQLRQGFEAEKKRAREIGIGFLDEVKRDHGVILQPPGANNGSPPGHEEHAPVDNDDSPPIPVPPPRGSRRSKRGDKRSSRDGHQQQGSGHDSTTGAESIAQGVHARSVSVPHPTAGTSKTSHRRVASVNPSTLNGSRTDPRVVDFGLTEPQPAPPSSHEHGSVQARSVLSYEPAHPTHPDEPPPQVPIKQSSVMSHRSVISAPRADLQTMSPSLSPVASKALKDEIGRLTYDLDSARQLLDSSHRRVQDLEEAVARLTAELNTSGGSLHILLQDALTTLMINMMGLREEERLPQPLRHRYWLRIPVEGTAKQLLRPDWREPFAGKKKWYKPWASKPSWPKAVISKFRAEAPYLANNNTTLALFRTLSDNDVRLDLEVVYENLRARWDDECKEEVHERGYYSEDAPPPSPSLGYHPANGHTE